MYEYSRKHAGHTVSAMPWNSWHPINYELLEEFLSKVWILEVEGQTKDHPAMLFGIFELQSAKFPVLQ